MIDVLWAVPVSDMGGVARHVRDVFAHGVPGCSLTLLVPPGPFAEVAQRQGHRVIVAPFGPAHGLGASRRSLRHARATSGATVVHSHLAYADFVVALTSLEGAARVSTEHGIAKDDRVYHASVGKAKVMECAHRVRLARFDALIAVSHATERALREKWHPPRRIPLQVIVNGIDRPELVEPVGTPATSEAFHVATLARLSPEKGLFTLLDAFASILGQFPKARLTLAGDGPLREQLEARIEELGIADAVHCPGFVDGIDAIGDVDVIVQLSVWENCSYALLDALVTGCGIVATDVGGNPELLPRQCLVPEGDVAAAADRIVSQALARQPRPTLRDGWPTVSDMCTSLARVYERVGA